MSIDYEDFGSIKNINSQHLSNKALVLISKIARALRDQNGFVLQLNDPGMIRNLSIQVKGLNHAELNRLYEILLDELEQHSNTINTNSSEVGLDPR